jgi:AraC-like DNA-binding protein
MRPNGGAPPAARSDCRRDTVPAASGFTEADLWRAVGAGWRPLYGKFQEQGLSFEWHDFTTDGPLDWSRSFHPDSVELCLNLDGRGYVSDGRQRAEVLPLTAAFYHNRDGRLVGERRAGERHRFLAVEFSPGFLREHLRDAAGSLHPVVRAAVNGRAEARAVSEPQRLTAQQLQTVRSLQHPVVAAQAQRLWFQAKALELIAAFFFRSASGEELFCERQKRLNLDRIDRVIAILKENLAEPPSLEELGRRVGCSHFYLSRTFSQEMGRTISQYLRDLRMERAAELLRSGRHNVTEVALEVGYSSLSHFSTAFHETFGCCPGLYPVATPGQRAMRVAKGG